jgi:hypothetical protein
MGRDDRSLNRMVAGVMQLLRVVAGKKRYHSMNKHAVLLTNNPANIFSLSQAFAFNRSSSNNCYEALSEQKT